MYSGRPWKAKIVVVVVVVGVVVVVESIILLIIIIDDPVESGPAHFCSTVQLELLFFLESSFLHHKVMARQNQSFCCCVVFLHACAFVLISVLQNSTPRGVWPGSL